MNMSMTIDPKARLDEARSTPTNRTASLEVDRLVARLDLDFFCAVEGVTKDVARRWLDCREPDEMPPELVDQLGAVTVNLLQEAYNYAIGAINADGVYISWYPDRESYEQAHSSAGDWDYEQYRALVVLTYVQTYALAGDAAIAFVDPPAGGALVTYDKRPF